MNPSLKKAQRIVEDEPDEALRLCSDVLNDNPDDAQALFIAGYVMMKAERYGLAHNLFRRCNALNPDKSEIHNSLGLSLEYCDPPGALRHFERALDLNPDSTHGLINKGLALLRLGDPQGCVDACTESLEKHPENHGAYDNRAYGHLMLRNWAQGWDDYTHSLGLTRTRREYGVPDWNGELGTVVVYGEQGVGDEILFASCIPDLCQTNDVIIDCDPRLEGVFARSFGVETYGTRFREHTPIVDNHQIDYQVAMGELPRFFRRKEEDFPGHDYLIADDERRLQWRALFDTLPGKKIGIAWTGGLRNTLKGQRSFDLMTFAPLFHVGHTLLSLEYIEPDVTGTPVRHYGRAVNKGVDYDETLAFIAELDLVICVTTTAVHAAGALGVECWCLVPKYPSYRFHLEGEMPWHSSVRLFRQKTSWDDLIEEVKAELEVKWSESSLVSIQGNQ